MSENDNSFESAKSEDDSNLYNSQFNKPDATVFEGIFTGDISGNCNCNRILKDTLFPLS